jgi:hypothetical protein
MEVAAPDNGLRAPEVPRASGCGKRPLCCWAVRRASPRLAALTMGHIERQAVLLNVRVITAEVFTHLALVTLAPGVHPPWRQRNRPQDTENRAHGYSLCLGDFGCQARAPHMSSLVRNVPFLTSIEVSPFSSPTQSAAFGFFFVQPKRRRWESGKPAFEVNPWAETRS